MGLSRWLTVFRVLSNSFSLISFSQVELHNYIEKKLGPEFPVFDATCKVHVGVQQLHVLRDDCEHLPCLCWPEWYSVLYFMFPQITEMQIIFLFFTDCHSNIICSSVICSSVKWCRKGVKCWTVEKILNGLLSKLCIVIFDVWERNLGSAKPTPQECITCWWEVVFDMFVIRCLWVH